MLPISLKIRQLLERLTLDLESGASMVPKSDSAGAPGDFLFFRYRQEGPQRLVMLVQPIAKDAATGNLLLTCILVSPDEYTEADQLRELYTSRSEDDGDDVYRTFIMSLIRGPLYRINL